MIRHSTAREDRLQRVTLDHKRQQFAAPSFDRLPYLSRLNSYRAPPTAEISLEQFEQWAIDRLRILVELEGCSFRNKTPTETLNHMNPLLQKWLPLHANTSAATGANDDVLQNERQKDHYSHFILRLAFSSTEELRRRFLRVESALFKMRFMSDDARERQDFVQSLNLGWQAVPESERVRILGDVGGQAKGQAQNGIRRNDWETGPWFKIEFEAVPELIESRKILLRESWAYVPAHEQMSIVLSSFTKDLERGLALATRALPRLDEDDRLTPILNHLSKNFATPDSGLLDSNSAISGSEVTAASIDSLSVHFPLCMRNLHNNLQKNSHLKHFGRLQYTLFLKGIGLSLEECLIFWRRSFKLMSDETFTKEYKYNVRHAYGDVGGDANRRGRGNLPYSCQRILLERPPGAGENHGCPYRHFSPDNLATLLQSTGVHDTSILQQVRDDVLKQRYHIACNRVFDWSHKAQIKVVKDDGTWPAADFDTIVHPNTFFKRSYMLKTSRSKA